MRSDGDPSMFAPWPAPRQCVGDLGPPTSTCGPPVAQAIAQPDGGDGEIGPRRPTFFEAVGVHTGALGVI